MTLSNSQAAIASLKKESSRLDAENERLEKELGRNRSQSKAVAVELNELVWNTRKGIIIRKINARHGDMHPKGTLFKVTAVAAYHPENHLPSVWAVVKKKDGSWGSRDFHLIGGDWEHVKETS